MLGERRLPVFGGGVHISPSIPVYEDKHPFRFGVCRGDGAECSGNGVSLFLGMGFRVLD